MSDTTIDNDDISDVLQELMLTLAEQNLESGRSTNSDALAKFKEAMDEAEG